MKLYLHDITQRRDRDGRMVTWLSERLLTEEVGVSKDYLRFTCRRNFRASVSPAKRNKTILPDTKRSWRYAKLNGQFCYDYDRLPQNRKEQLPGKDLLLQQYNSALKNDRRARLKSNIEAVLKTDCGAYVHHYRGDYEHIQTLAKACAIINYMAKEVAAVETTGKCQLLKDFSNLMDGSGVAYLPRHWRRLGEKIDAVLNGKPIEQVVRLPRSGNKNARQYDDPELMSWLLQMRRLQANYTNAFVIRKLRTMCVLAEKKAPSKSWFESKLAEPLTKFLTADRFGSGKLSDRYKGYIPIENALHAGDCWMADGTRVNMIAFKDADGKERFLYWLAILDVHSGDIVGVHFDTKEDRWGYINALKMAVAHTGYLPYELVIDRFPGHNTEEIKILIQRLEIMGVKVTITSKSTGKAKVERTFETIQSVFMAESEWYYGEGVQSRRDSAHRSPEYIAKQKKKRKDGAWSFDEAYKEMMRVLDLYRSTELSRYSTKFSRVQMSPREMQAKSDKPHAIRAELWQTVQLFGLEKTVAIRKGGVIKTTIQRVDYHFVVDEYDTIANHNTVRLCYDMEDLTEVYIFANNDDPNRDYLGTATEQRKVQIYGPGADGEGIGRAQARLKHIEDARNAHYEDLVEVDGADGDEVNILLGPLADKIDKGEAESAWLEERAIAWKDKGKPRLLEQEAPEDMDEQEISDLVSNARSQY